MGVSDVILLRLYEINCDYNVTRLGDIKHNELKTDKKITEARWLDNNEKIKLSGNNSFVSWPFDYGTSLGSRVARLRLS